MHLVFIEDCFNGAKKLMCSAFLAAAVAFVSVILSGGLLVSRVIRTLKEINTK